MPRSEPRAASGRAATRSAVLDLVRSHGTLSRVELAERTGLTPATITHVVRELVADGLVHEVGRQRSGGSPRRLLAVDPSRWYAVGVQLDRCSATVVVLDFAGRTAARTTLRGSGHEAPDRYLALVARRVRALLDDTGVPAEHVLGVGVATHGPQDTERGVLLTPQPTPAWREHTLVTDLATRLGLPVRLENDATAAAVGEQWAGEQLTAGAPATFGLVYCSSGLGGGVVVDGVAYRGLTGNAVELGHITLDRRGPRCRCGNRGCVEVVAGPEAVVARARAEPTLAHLGLTGRPDDTLTGLDLVARAARDGNRAAARLLDDAGDALGVAAVTLANLFDLDVVVFAGPALRSTGEAVVRRVQSSLARAAYNRDLRPVRARLSTHGTTAAAVGVAVAVLRGPPPPRTAHAAGPGTRAP